MSGTELTAVWPLVVGIKGECVRSGNEIELIPFTKGFVGYDKASVLAEQGKVQLMVGLGIQDLKTPDDVKIKQAVIPETKEAVIPKARTSVKKTAQSKKVTPSK